MEKVQNRICEEYWKGKNAAFLGDSITDGVGVNKGERYFDLLDGKTGIISHGYGVNGSDFFGLLKQAKKMNEELGKNVDAIFLLAGTNDYNGSKLLGDWYDYTDEEAPVEIDDEKKVIATEIRRRRAFNFNSATFKGSINAVLSYLKHEYADKQIVLMTPLHRGYAAFGGRNTQPCELFPNRLGLYIDDYVNAVKEAANVWATELIDLNAVSGIFPLYDESAEKYLSNIDTDRLHPGKEGHARMAEVIARKMNSIALF